MKLGEPTIRAALEKLAFQTHQRQGGERERADAPADIPFGEMLGVLAPLLPDDINPENAPGLPGESGRLIDRPARGRVRLSPSVVSGIPGRVHLANSEPDFAARLRELVWEDMDWWREVFLLGVESARADWATQST
ncbi:MAG: hypothetical protein M0C28_24995 [Candidatus Moduliflexus flocculans]|nr:hypothetical protein [Candidatus Moduliflexus flocculans]